jgi:ornithine carbamoyltransferase
MLGASFACASPAARQLDSDTIELASKVAAHANAAARVVSTQSAIAAVAGADVVYTDTYVSMGDEAQKAELLAIFGDNYRVTPKLMQAAKSGAFFMHDMPAYRGNEVDAAVIDGPQSLVVQQAHNRMHSIKAILLFVLGLEDALE